MTVVRSNLVTLGLLDIQDEKIVNGKVMLGLKDITSGTYWADCQVAGATSGFEANGIHIPIDKTAIAVAIWGAGQWPIVVGFIGGNGNGKMVAEKPKWQGQLRLMPGHTYSSGSAHIKNTSAELIVDTDDITISAQDRVVFNVDNGSIIIRINGKQAEAKLARADKTSAALTDVLKLVSDLAKTLAPSNPAAYAIAMTAIELAIATPSDVESDAVVVSD